MRSCLPKQVSTIKRFKSYGEFQLTRLTKKQSKQTQKSKHTENPLHPIKMQSFWQTNQIPIQKNVRVLEYLSPARNEPTNSPIWGIFSSNPILELPPPQILSFPLCSPHLKPPFPFLPLLTHLFPRPLPPSLLPAPSLFSLVSIPMYDECLNLSLSGRWPLCNSGLNAGLGFFLLEGDGGKKE